MLGTLLPHMHKAYNPFMSNQPPRKTYFGAFALLAALLSFVSIVMRFVSAYLNISPSLFNQLNGLTTLLYCILAPLAAGLGILGFVFKNDSKSLSLSALAVAAIPFLILMVQFILELVKYN